MVKPTTKPAKATSAHNDENSLPAPTSPKSGKSASGQTKAEAGPKTKISPETKRAADKTPTSGPPRTETSGSARSGGSGTEKSASGHGAAKRQAARHAAMSQPPHPRPRGAGPEFGTVPFTLKRAVSRHGQVTAVSMMKDEGPFVLEWVAHHLSLGFTDLVVYTNDCSDGTDDMLIRLEHLGLVHHRRNVIPEGIRPQPSALSHAQAEPVVGLSDWVMVFDADEFLSIRYGNGGLEDLLDAAVAQEANGIVITWRIFGSGGVTDWSRAPVTEQYLQAAPPEWNKGWGVKTLFKFDPEAWNLGIHRPKMKTRVLKTDFPDQVKWLNGSGRVMEDYFKFRGWRSITRTVGYDWVQLNHYAVKSVESYALRKLRGNVNNKKDKYNSDYWSLQDRNETRDETMLRYHDRREVVMGHLLADPELSRLHEAALQRVEARLAELRQTETYHSLLADLARASEVPIGQIVAKPPQARDPAKIAALMSDVEKLRTSQARSARKANPTPSEVGKWLGGPYADPLLPNSVFQGDWVRNHDILLPCDPGLFSAPALALVAKGKFERSLARLLPSTIPPRARVLDLGAGCGFLALHLARQRPDLTLVWQEDEPALQDTLRRIEAQNEMSGTPNLQHDPRPLLDTGLLEILTQYRPETVLLGDPCLAERNALNTLMAAAPRQIICTTRFTEAARADRASITQNFASAGYEITQSLDSASVWAFSRIPSPSLPAAPNGTAV